MMNKPAIFMTTNILEELVLLMNQPAMPIVEF